MEFLDNIIENDVKKGVFPGMTYGIVSGGEIILGGAGYKSLVPKSSNIDINTLYDIASLTKVVVVVPIICKLLVQKKIKLTDSVNKYLPRFRYNEINIAHLLLHISGLPADTNCKKIVTKEELMNQVYAAEKIYKEETKVLYSDLGYILLGEVIEKIYGKPLDIVAKEEVFIPLEMNSTCFNPVDKKVCAPTEVTADRGIIQGNVHDEKAYSLGGVAGHAGVFTNAEDLTKFLSMILNDGIYNGKEFLPKEIIDTWFKTIVYDKKNEWTRSFCWITGVNDLVMKEGENAIAFTGFTGPSLSVDRDKKIGIVLLTNRIHPTRDNKLLSQERPNITEEIYKHLVKIK